MNPQEKFDRLVTRYPHDHTHFWRRPLSSRRQFFQLLGAGVSGCFLWPPRSLTQTPTWTAAGVKVQGRARQAIFILLAGAPSHTDLFDLKVLAGVTPNNFQPEDLNGVLFPVGLMPRIAEQFGKVATVRSVRSWSAVHGLAQTWTQIGRNPTSLSGRIAPHIGSIVAVEKHPERRPGQTLPSFLQFNVGNSPAAGYLPGEYAPLRMNPSAGGLGSTTHPAGEVRFNDRWRLLHTLDDSLRVNSPLGKPGEDLNDFYDSARALMYNPTVDQIFRFTTADSQRYGNTAFGNACLVAGKTLAANQGARFIQINFGGWDHHGDIYSPNNLYAQARTLDNGLGTLIADLAAAGLLEETLIVACGEFGRTVGRLTGRNGRDHFLQQFVFFAGGGIQGGRAIGVTNETGAFTIDPGWSRQRDVRIEDVEATLYSALGINWTTIRYDDPFRRGFEYVPFAREDTYGPIDELWG